MHVGLLIFLLISVGIHENATYDLNVEKIYNKISTIGQQLEQQLGDYLDIEAPISKDERQRNRNDEQDDGEIVNNDLELLDTIEKFVTKRIEKYNTESELQLSNEKYVNTTTMTEYDINEQNGFTYPEEKFSNENENITSSKRAVGVDITLWPKDNKGELHIPYVIGSSISKGSVKYNKIIGFISTMNRIIKCNANTWLPRTNEVAYVNFMDSKGCASYVGKISSPQPQPIFLADGCVLYNTGTVIHEMMHAMGFYHEHQRADRDQYVTINYANIITGKENNFRKIITRKTTSPYDYGSVMHYGARFFSKNWKNTISTVKNSDANKMGQRIGASDKDIQEINDLYQCFKTPTKPAIFIGSCSHWLSRQPCVYHYFDVLRAEPRRSPLGRPRKRCRDRGSSWYCERVLRRFSDACKWSSFIKRICKLSCAQCAGDAFLSAYRKAIHKRTTCRTYRHRRWYKYCVRWNFKTVVTPSVIYSEISGNDIRRATNCTCNKENCEEKKYCASIRYRRVVMSHNLILSTSNMSVCLKNTDFRHGMSAKCDESNTHYLEDRNVDNQWHTAKFSFKAKCDDLEITVSVQKGIDGFHLDNSTLHVGDCPTDYSDKNEDSTDLNFFDAEEYAPVLSETEINDEEQHEYDSKVQDTKEIQGKVEQLSGELKSLTDQLKELDSTDIL